MPQSSITHLSSRLALLDRPRSRRLLRWTFWSALSLYFAFILLVVALRVAVLPQINRYRDDIASAIGRAIGQSVSIRAIDGHWSGLRPLLNLHGIEIHDAAGRSVLGFDQVSAEPGWSSLWHGELRLAHLELSSPHLLLRRDGNGHLFVAGLDVTLQNTNKGFGKWLLAQHRIQVTDATITWQDDLRHAPPLTLSRLNLRLENGWRAHRLGVAFTPPAALAAPLDIRAEFTGDDPQQRDAWSGQLFVQGERIDLAGWHPWIDYPIRLTKGNGALRLWLNVAQKRITAVTADLQLTDAHLRIRDDLPELGLTRLGGRLAAERSPTGFALTTRQLTLATDDGIDLAATDLALRWQAREGDPPQGDLTANRLDLSALRRLAAYLPLPATTRLQLDHYAPQGRVDELQLSWRGAAEHLAQWSLKGRLQQLGMRNLGPLAVVAGISGEIDGNEKTGKLRLDGRQSLVELPTVFAEPRIALDSFAATANWKTGAEGLRIELTQASFANPDAAGEASGVWQAGTGGGRIDLTGHLTRANGAAVWRYMPLTVSQHTRDWLRNSIRGGVADDVKLVLKGDLRDFPFAAATQQPPRGVFEVRGPFHAATLDYAEGWPPITDIDGELLFAGERMLITGKSGRIFSVNLRDVRAEIADLKAPEELLTVTGQAQGPSAEFLRYIEASPIGGYIDHFTENMRAEGNGALALTLKLPLRKLADTRVAGEYRFDGNRLTVDASLPPLADVRGALRFSERRIEASNLRGTLLGMPLSGGIKTSADHGVDIAASGDFAVAALRRQISHPLLDNLAGSAKWNGTMSIRQKTATLRIDSTLVGLSSSLPEPFNKTANEALALSLERRVGDGATQKVGADGTANRRAPAPFPREILVVNLGQRAQARLARRLDTTPPRFVWGRVRVGNAAPFAGDAAQENTGRGVQINVDLPHLDGDAWSRLLRDNGGTAGEPDDTAPLPAIQMDLRIGELTLFEQSLHELRLNGQSPAEAARFNPRLTLKSRETNGTLEWLGGGKGHLSARLDRLSLPKPQAPAPLLRAKAGEVVDQLPALDVNIADFSFDGRSLGKLHLVAENEASQWNARIDINNEDDALQSRARWRPRDGEETQLDFTLKTRSVEKFLQRIGYVNVIRRGAAATSGALTWRGPPFRIDYPSLAGKFKLEATNGQFNKLEPGVGRLLGILSLQSLPRRITLDFRDVFSEGFAFNAIDGEFLVTKGVAQTENLRINGPAANVLMSGVIDLGAETQNLQVLIQPAVSDSVSVGTLLVHPAVGAAVWAAQKLLKDPLGKALAYEYRITGPWGDPQVVKFRSSPSPPAQPSPPADNEGADK